VQNLASEALWFRNGAAYWLYHAVSRVVTIAAQRLNKATFQSDNKITQ